MIVIIINIGVLIRLGVRTEDNVIRMAVLRQQLDMATILVQTFAKKKAIVVQYVMATPIGIAL